MGTTARFLGFSFANKKKAPKQTMKLQNERSNEDLHSPSRKHEGKIKESDIFKITMNPFNN
jgi:hypothetical protein